MDSTFLGYMPDGPEQRAAALADAGIDAVNLHHTEWTGGLTALFHRFGVLCFGWDAQHDRILDGLLDVGIDAVYSDHVDRMVDALVGAASASAAHARLQGADVPGGPDEHEGAAHDGCRWGSGHGWRSGCRRSSTGCRRGRTHAPPARSGARWRGSDCRSGRR